MNTEIRKRLRWVQLFEELANYTQVCLRCGISRPTLRKWVSRYRLHGMDGLLGNSRRPLTSPSVRITERERGWIAELRARRLGSRRIQSELRRCQSFEVSRPVIEKA